MWQIFKTAGKMFLFLCFNEFYKTRVKLKWIYTTMTPNLIHNRNNKQNTQTKKEDDKEAVKAPTA